MKKEFAEQPTIAARQLLQQLIAQSSEDEVSVDEYIEQGTYPFAELVQLSEGFMGDNATMLGNDAAALLSGYFTKIDIGVLEDEIPLAAILEKTCSAFHGATYKKQGGTQ
jgi:hypothetical protein